jgi:beta-ribofuranosylaminobenzene 5'-phosphate synthase
MKVTINAPSRLHFSLIDMNGSFGRIDGGVGVTLDKPNTEVTAELKDPDIKINYDELRTRLPRNLINNTHININTIIPRHCGLGSTTQRELAVAKAMDILYSLNKSTHELAEMVGRGGTSGIGVNAFEHGGFILEGGHTYGEGKQKNEILPSRYSIAVSPPPLLMKYKFPEDWFFVVSVPNGEGLNSEMEKKEFSKLFPVPSNEACHISRTILMSLLPSLLEKDIETFGKALTNLQLGRKYPIISHKCMDLAKENGAFGVGVSSFGPANYALVQGEISAQELKNKMDKYLQENGGGFVFYSKVRNSGAEIIKEE